MSRTFTKIAKNIPKFYEFSQQKCRMTLASGQPLLLDFSDHKLAYGRYTNWELMRALTILKICNVDTFVDNSLKVFQWGNRFASKRLMRAIVKPTFYAQFVGGETPVELEGCLRHLWEAGVLPMVLPCTPEEDGGYAETGDAEYDRNLKTNLDCLNIMGNFSEKCEPLLQLKVGALLSEHIIKKLGISFENDENKVDHIKRISSILSGNEENFSILDENEKVALRKGAKRLQKLCRVAQENGCNIAVDAEYTYLNPGLLLFALGMMGAFNTERAVIWNTFQCYLKNALPNVQLAIELTSKMNVKFGAKIVRGAYLSYERDLAKEHGYEDPTCSTYEATSENYDRVINYMLQSITKIQGRLIVATHNHNSIQNAVKRITELNIDKKHGGVCFGQIFGMAERSGSLVAAGFNVHKSVPYGPLDEVLPYLSRRAAENKSVLQGVRFEHRLQWAELKGRLIS